MGQTVKTLVFWSVVVLTAFLLWQVVRVDPKRQPEREIPYSDFLTQVEGGNVRTVRIAGRQIDGKFGNGELFHVIGPMSEDGMIALLHASNVQFSFSDENNKGLTSLLLTLTPFVILVALWFFMIRQIKQKQPSSSARA